MPCTAVKAIADLVEELELHADYVIPGPIDHQRVATKVAAAVAKAAIESGVGQVQPESQEVELMLV